MQSTLFCCILLAEELLRFPGRKAMGIAMSTEPHLFSTARMLARLSLPLQACPSCRRSSCAASCGAPGGCGAWRQARPLCGCRYSHSHPQQPQPAACLGAAGAAAAAATADRHCGVRDPMWRQRQRQQQPRPAACLGSLGTAARDCHA